MTYKSMLVAIATLFACTPAAAQDNCFEAEGCDIGLNFPTLDYTVPDNGQTYKWTLRIDYPGATVHLGGPNEVDFIGQVRTDHGLDSAPNMRFPYRFEEIVAPNVTTIFVWAPKGQDTCNQPGPIGEICFRYYRVWGNGTFASFTGLPDDVEIVHLYGSVEAVPEPASWAMMLLGFGVIGAGARRPRYRSAHAR